MGDSTAFCRVLVATRNRGKLEEFRHFFEMHTLERRFVLVSLANVGIEFEVEELGLTFEENAIEKATAYSRSCGLLTLADDSGLCVDALEGAPGVHSSRYAGESSTDEANNQKLLGALKDVPRQHRTAHFACALVLAKNGVVLESAFGRCDGYIGKTGSGSHGFGYDPIFLLGSGGRSAAKLNANQKAECSHRYQALKAMAPLLERHLNDGHSNDG